MSRLQEQVKIRLQFLGVTGMVDDYRFVAEHYGTGRGLRERLLRDGMNDFELDMAIPALRIGIEVNGGQFAGRKSGHGSTAGLERDAKKINQATFLGWRVFVITSTMARDGSELQRIAEYIKNCRSGE